jgi:hypothetical protein
MTHIQTLTVGALHTAHLDHMYGVGLAVQAHHDSDVYFGSESVNAADWMDAGSQLDALAWEPLEDDETGGWVEEGVTADGRMVIALYSREPICSNPSLEELAASHAALRALVFGGDQ